MYTLQLHIATDKFIPAFCRMLFHSLWQGLLLAVIVSAALIITRSWKAAARYNLILILFAGFLLTTVYTFAAEWQDAATGSARNIFPGRLSGRVAQLFFGNLQQIKTILDACSGFCAAHEQSIVILWLLFFTLKMCRMVGAWLYNRQMKQKMASVPDIYWNDIIVRLCAILKIKKLVVMLESGCMKMPVVIGHIKPLILVPAGLLMSLTPEQAEAILLHELAHIKRNDYLVNFLQHIAEAIFFFNPAVWWVSSCLREERENCCDDVALAHTQNKIGLAEALISFKERQLYSNSLQTAFPGKKNQLFRRVSRILDIEVKTISLSRKLFYGATFIVLLAMAGTVMLMNDRMLKEKRTFNKKEENTINPVMYRLTTSVPPLKNAAQKQLQQVVVATKKKTLIIEKPVIIKEKTETVMYRETAALSHEQMLASDQEQSIQDMANAKLDQEQALRDQKQGELDQQQAVKNQLQFAIDLNNAKLMHEKASLNRQQAIQDKKEAERKSLKYQSLSQNL